MKPRIIVCGLGRTGYKIFSLLRQQGTFVVGISNRPLPQETENIVVGDGRSSSTLIAAGILDSHTLVLAGADDALNLAILVQARLLNPNIYVVNRLFNTSLGDRVDRTLNAHVTLSVSALAAPIFAFAALGSQAIGQLTIYDRVWPIHEEYIDRNHPWNGISMAELWDNRSRMLIYYLPVRGRTDLVGAVVENRQVQVGDRLIVASKPSDRPVNKSFGKKFTKLLVRLRQVRQPAQSTALVVLTLLLTIFLATVTYTSINLETSFIDALYFSVGMITGAGGQEEVAEEAPALIKLFTAVMMLVGAGTIGICYALLNDLVLGTRFRQLWKAPPMPAKNHYIVCGLGNIGVQTVKQLQMNGCEVVAIEIDPLGRFVRMAQSLNVRVIQGNASVPEILQAANIHTCEALAALTSNDITNLEIALTAKGLVPDLRVIVRDRDPLFALRAQQVFEFKSVLSPIELAAPAFAAAALGGRVLGNGTIAGNLWIALSMKITAEHPFFGQRVKDAAMQSDFVPLYLETPCQIFHGWELLETHLCQGDILYMTIPANRLEQLWRVSPAQFIDLTKK
ncbi:MAG: NAD-binding protein [Cyanobacteriota bacterium]|nr:NAD-binding protein [Cyanobacteriota bacterium]